MKKVAKSAQRATSSCKEGGEVCPWGPQAAYSSNDANVTCEGEDDEAITIDTRYKRANNNRAPA